ncbi:MAG TPA: hypothetical protein VHZ54_15455 [Solirubrobacterales bacterium]|jgi:hypothetical protein|nr:hypothetical protein [Solirubrobacterales bacterium]
MTRLLIEEQIDELNSSPTPPLRSPFRQGPDGWISPIGQSITEVFAEEEALDPRYAAERTRNRHLQEVGDNWETWRHNLGYIDYVVAAAPPPSG